MSARWANRLVARIYTALPALAARWGRKSAALDASLLGERIPWSPAGVALRGAVVALVTTGGVHLKSQPAFDMKDPDGDPSFRLFSADTDPSALTITHDYYNHADADRDLNLVAPMERLRELVARGVIGALHPQVFALMGHIDGAHIETLINVSAPQVARRLADAGVDYALLVPA